MTTAKMTYSDIRDLLDAVPTDGMKVHYLVGAYQSMMARMVADLPKHKQKEFAMDIESLTARVKQITH